MINDARQTHDAPDTVTITLGADKGDDVQKFIEALQEMGVAPRVGQNTSGRKSAVPDSMAHGAGYAISQQKRKLIEHGSGCVEMIGNVRQVMVRGLKKVDQLFVGEWRADDDANREVNDIPPQGECLEFFQHANVGPCRYVTFQLGAFQTINLAMTVRLAAGIWLYQYSAAPRFAKKFPPNFHEALVHFKTTASSVILEGC
jgi:hypothetical protein